MSYYLDWLLTPEERERLQAANVRFSEVGIGTATYHRFGLMMEESTLENVLDLLGVIRDEDEDDELQTPQGDYLPGVTAIKVTDRPTPLRPVVEIGGNYLGTEYLSILAASYAELKLTMVTQFWDGECDYRHIYNALYVAVFSFPDWESIEEVDGFGYRSTRFEASPNISTEYLVIRDQENRTLGLFKGDVTGGTLWLPFNFGRDPEDGARLAYVMYVLARRLHPELGEIASYTEVVTERRQEIQRQRFAQLAQLRLEQEINELDTSLRESDSRVENARQRYVETMRAAQAARVRYQYIQERDEGSILQEMLEEFSREFDQLLNSADFESVDFDGQTVTVKTRPLVLVYDEQSYGLGRYQIMAGRDSIRIESLDGVRGDRYECHPHVRDGRPCLGNLGTSISKLQATMSYGVLMPMLVAFLETAYNPIDSYVRIEALSNVQVIPPEEGANDTETVEQPRRRRRLRGNNSDVAETSS